MPWKPSSPSVGTSGSVGRRRELETASARSLPALICASGPEIAPDPTGGSPPTTAATIGPAPLYCTGVVSTFASTLKSISAVRCGVVPAPGDA